MIVQEYKGLECVLMEWALSIPNDQSVQIEEVIKFNMGYFSSPINTINYEDIIYNRYGKVKVKRIYIGQEFCERKIPSIHETNRLIKELQLKGIPFTFVTPYVSETGIKKVEEVLNELVKLEPESEVVVNDWGVLYLLRNEYPTLKPVLGRLLNKVLRDPRLFAYLKNEIIKNNKNSANLRNTLEDFTRSNLQADSMKELLKAYQVDRIEIDYPPQGLDQEIKEGGYEVSLYLPFACVTTGRICLTGGWGLERQSKFNANVKQCSKACFYSWLEMHDKSLQIKKNRNWEIIQKGNTVFLSYGENSFKNAMEEAERAGIDRIIFQAMPL